MIAARPVNITTETKCSLPSEYNKHTVLTFMNENCKEPWQTDGCTDCDSILMKIPEQKLCGCYYCQPCDVTGSCLYRQCDSNFCHPEFGECHYSKYTGFECRCAENHGGPNCSYATSCAILNCRAPYYICYTDPSSYESSCIHDLLTIRLRYGNRRVQSCEASEDCIDLHKSVCSHGYCGCPDGRVAYNNSCEQIWVPCPKESQCVLYTPESTCNNTRLVDMDFTKITGGSPYLSESDCLCVLYADTVEDANRCISYREVAIILPPLIEKKTYFKFDNPVLMPIIVGIVSLIGSLGIIYLKYLYQKKSQKKLEDFIAKKKKYEKSKSNFFAKLSQRELQEASIIDQRNLDAIPPVLQQEVSPGYEGSKTSLGANTAASKPEVDTTSLGKFESCRSIAEEKSNKNGNTISLPVRENLRKAQASTDSQASVLPNTADDQTTAVPTTEGQVTAVSTGEGQVTALPTTQDQVAASLPLKDQTADAAIAEDHRLLLPATEGVAANLATNDSNFGSN